MRKKYLGFTLLEMIIVISLMALMFSILSPIYHEYLIDKQTENIASKIIITPLIISDYTQENNNNLSGFCKASNPNSGLSRIKNLLGTAATINCSLSAKRLHIGYTISDSAYPLLKGLTYEYNYEWLPRSEWYYTSQTPAGWKVSTAFCIIASKAGKCVAGTKDNII